MSAHSSQSDKDRLKEAAQRERANQARQISDQSTSMPLFDGPRKVQYSNNDQTIRQIRKVLGDWDKMQGFVQNKSESQTIIGATRQPMTPQPGRISADKPGFTFVRPGPQSHPNGSFRREHKSDSRKSLESRGHGHDSRKHAETKSKSEQKPSAESKHGPESRSTEPRTSHEHKGTNEPKGGKQHSLDPKLGRDHKSTVHAKAPDDKSQINHRSKVVKDGGVSADVTGGGKSSMDKPDKSSHSKHYSSHSHSQSQSHSSRASSVSPAKHGRLSQSPVASAHSQSKTCSAKRCSQSPSPSPGPPKIPQPPPSSKPVSAPPPKEATPPATKSQSQNESAKSSSSAHFTPASTAPPVTPVKSMTTPPPNGLVLKGLTDSGKNKLPTLLIPSENKATVDHKDLDDIFKEMIHSHPPLTGIYTPQKTEKFPFPVKDPLCPEPSDKSLEDKTIDEDKPQPPVDSTKANILLSDIDISNDSDTEKVPEELHTSKNSAISSIGKRKLSMESSSSDSSSDGSDSSTGSDAETSSSDGEEEEEKKEKPPCVPVTTPKSPPKDTTNWGLRNFLNGINKPSPEPPVSLETKPTPKRTTTPEKINNENSVLVEKLLLKNIGHSDTLPFSTDHFDNDIVSELGQEQHQNGTDSAGDIVAQILEKGNSSMRSFGSPDTASTSSSASSKHAGKSKSTHKSHRRHSSAVEKVQRTPKSEGAKTSSSTPSKSNVADTGNGGKPRTTPRQNSRKESSSQRERKKKKTNCVKSKEWISDDSENDIVDVVSVTPDEKASKAEPVVDEDKALVSKQLFSSPRTEKVSPDSSLNVPPPSSTTVEKEKNDTHKDVLKEKGKETKHKSSGHRKTDKDRSNKGGGHEKHKRKDHSRKASESKMDIQSEKHADDMDIIQSLQTTKEFKPPSLLSPIPPFTTPTKSPAQSWSSHSLSSRPSPGLTCLKDGKPSVVVRINLSFLDHIPSIDNSQSASEVMEQSMKLCDDNKVLESLGIKQESVSVCSSSVDKREECVPSQDSKVCEPSSVEKTKPSKRKVDSDRPDNVKRHKPSSKSSSMKTSEDIENGSHETESGEKKPERRGSTSSTSSRHSNKSHSKKIKIESKVKREPSPDMPTKGKEAVPQQNGQTHLPFNSYSEKRNHVKSEFAPGNSPHVPHQRSLLEEKLEPADKYLAKAKELKHQADKDKPAKFSMYLEAVLSFIQCGYAMEKEQISEPNKIFTMYHETFQLIKHTCRFRSGHTDAEMPLKDKKLSVLILRIQSLLCLKLFNLKKSEAMKFKKIIDHDHSKTSSSKPSAHAPSPHQSSWNNRSTGTPSPMSPTPSPAGSIGSVGSQGSCDLSSSKLTNGSLSGSNTMTSPGTVSVPQRIHSVMQQYIYISSYLVQCHDLWAQADAASQECRDFFDDLDSEGSLTLHSNVLELVHYVKRGLQHLNT